MEDEVVKTLSGDMAMHGVRISEPFDPRWIGHIADDHTNMVCRTMTVHNALIYELEEALSHGSAERRAKTLRRITDLFVFGSSQFSKEHIAVFDNVFKHLISDIERSARVTLADRLAALPHAPPQVIRTLAFDDAIDVAGPVLTRSEQLDNVTLVENARTKSQQHLLAISRRKVIAETVTDVLVERGNRDVALSAAQNAGAKFSETGYVRLVRRSEGDDELAQAVGSRPEIPRQQFLKLLTSASSAVRQALEAANPGYAHEVRDVVAEVASAIQLKTATASRDFAAAQALGRIHAGRRSAHRRQYRGVRSRRKIRGDCCRTCDHVRRADRCGRACHGAGQRGDRSDRRAKLSGCRGRPRRRF